MERMQSTYENQVDYDLSESGVHPLRLEELLDEPGLQAAVLGRGSPTPSRTARPSCGTAWPPSKPARHGTTSR